MPYAMIIPPSGHGEVVRISLWATQVLLCCALVTGGVLKLTLPVARLSKMFSWTGEVSKPFLRIIGVVDLAGGRGILLPAVTNILPSLTFFAALGCTVLQLLAIGFHARRGEITETPFNFFMLALSLFVLWGWS